MPLWDNLLLTWIYEATLRDPEGAKNVTPTPVRATLERAPSIGAETTRLQPDGGGRRAGSPHQRSAEGHSLQSA